MTKKTVKKAIKKKNIKATQKRVVAEKQDILAQKTRAIAVLAKAISAFLGTDQAIFIEIEKKQHLVCWTDDGKDVKIQVGNFEGFQDGLLLETQKDKPIATIEIDGTKG